MSKERPTYPLLIEESSNYAFTVRRMAKPLSFDKLRNTSNRFYNDLPEEIRDELHNSILHGTCMLSSEPELNAYMHDMGKMHNAKLRRAFDNLSEKFYNAGVIDIIDYGCGQGLGIIAFSDHLRETRAYQQVRRIVLIEPSEMALRRAALHASVFFPDAELVTIKKGFDDLLPEDVFSEERVVTLHILSNVLDLGITPDAPDGAYDLDNFTDLIVANIEGENHFVCIEPLFGHPTTDAKLTRFCNGVGLYEYYKLVCDKGEFATGQTWTCAIVCGERTSGIYPLLKKRYSGIWELSDGMIKVSKDEVFWSAHCACNEEYVVTKYGFVNEYGEEITPCQYEEATDFRNGLAFVLDKVHWQYNRVWGAINKRGEVVIPFIYESIKWDNNDEYIIASVDGCADKYDKNGDMLYAKDRTIEYTSTDNNIIEISEPFNVDTGAIEKKFDASIISNTYTNGVGVIAFDKAITKIESEAFCSSNLTSIIIPHGVTSIGAEAFRCCLEMHSISLPNTLVSIGEMAFCECSLESVVIPGSVTEIGENAFWGSNVKTLICYANIPPQIRITPPEIYSLEDQCFMPFEVVSREKKEYQDKCKGVQQIFRFDDGEYMLQSDVKIYVPKQSVEEYKSALGWCEHADKIFAIESDSNIATSQKPEMKEIDVNTVNHDNIELYPQQQEALDAICAFLKSEDQIFILKGYAGTGKTTMIKALLGELDRKEKKSMLMAPTGRAAKILGIKTGRQASTIHRVIYSVDRLTSVRHDENGELIKMVNHFYKDKEEKRKHDIVEFWFGISTDHGENYNPQNTVYIIDESSMVSSRKTNNDIFHFGTDVLLDDLLEYAELLKGGKIIFVGDPAQLPPVGDNHSAALMESYFIDRGLKVATFELTEVIRQAQDSAILDNAMMVRDVINSKQRNALSFKRCSGQVEDILSSSMIAKYVEKYPEPAFGNSVIICYSNNHAKGYNDAIRTYYYPGEKYVQAGDILQVVKNHYIIIDSDSKDGELYNGDFVKVLDVSSQTETQSAPVWTKAKGCRKNISLTFRDVTVQSEDGSIYKMKIIDSLLNSSAPRLTPDEHTALYINFRMRNPDLPKNHEAAAKLLIEDPYYNALNVKYGYAITGHKSQGGDWDIVFVDYAGRTGLNDDSLRWIYTATTRAKKMLYGLNMPHIQPFDKLQFRPITKLNKLAANAQIVGNVGNVDMLSSNASASQKAKCLSVISALGRIGYRVDKIEQLQYKDRYHIQVNDVIEKYDCIYNGAGYYTAYNALNASEHSNAIIEALQSEECYTYQFDYVPSHKVLAELHAKVRSICDELGVSITNIIEDIKQYNVVYFLKTTGKYSYIKFYFDKNMFVTYGHPYSDIEGQDVLLNEIIAKLS